MAIVFSAVLSTIILLISGKDPLEAFQIMAEKGFTTDSQIYIIDRASMYYLAALAVAIGFRMNLFNIGVDGQYRMAAMLAAVVGGAVALPGPLHIALIVLTAVLVGAFWAGIVGVLKVTRGVNEVISSIMLNTIATGLLAYLIKPSVFGVREEGSNNLTTKPMPESAWFPNISRGDLGEIWGFVFVAAACGVAYWFLLARTRFGFDLRATGMSGTAAAASGVNVKRMVLAAMLISGGTAGLVGMPQLLSDSHQYSLDFPAGIGFIGIGIALLGRNHPVGIAFGALLWAFLDRLANPLDFAEIPKEIVTIMQGTIVIAVVVAYELVGRYSIRRQQSEVGKELAAAAAAKQDEEVPA
jgi:simple sugar transport system permease protein